MIIVRIARGCVFFHAVCGAAVLVSMAPVASSQTTTPAIPRAISHIEAGKLVAAEAELRTAFENGEDPAEAHNLMGGGAERKGDTEAAEKNFREASKLRPDSSVYHHNLGNILLQ